MTNVALGLVAFLVAGLYTFGILQIPLLGFGDPLGPRLLPMILTGVLVLVGGALILDGRRASTFRADYARLAGYVRSQDFRTVALVAAWTAAYFALFSPLGYLLSTAAFLLALTFTFHRGSRVTAAIVSILFSAGSYALFSGLFNVPLPRGILPL